MSFFAGRIGSKTVLSLNSASGTGNTVTSHNVPDTNSIFHSDMPHVYIEERLTVNLSNGGVGYYIGQMPANLQTYLNAGNRVIIPVLVYNYNGTLYRRQMTGRHEGTGYNYELGGLTNPVFTTNMQGHTHPDLMLEWGTFSRTSAPIETDISQRGTGGMMVRYGYGSGYDDILSVVAGNWCCGHSSIMYARNDSSGIKRSSERFWNPITNNVGYAGVKPAERQNILDPNWIAPLGPKGRGHTHVFVRADGSRIFGFTHVTVAGDLSDSRFRVTTPVNYTENLGDDNGYCSQVRGGFQDYIARGLFTTSSAITYPITPTAMEFLVLNLTWSQTGGYNATSIFTGAEIRISNNTFIIKDRNLMATQFEFLTAVSTGAPGNNANNFFATNNYSAAMNTYPDGGSLGLPGINSAGGTVMVPPSSGGSSSSSIPNWKVGTYKFPTSGAVMIDSRNNTISVAGKVIWSPSVCPLMLFASNKASNVIIGQNNNLIQVAEGGTASLGAVNIGLPAAGNSVIIMSMEYMSVGLHCPGGPWFEIGASAAIYYNGTALRLSRLDYDAGDSFQHQILVLPPNVYVPIHARRNYSFHGGSPGYPRGNIVYFVRKNGSNGNLEFYVYSLSKVGWINVPKYRINVQRLT